ncbi:hypothetical protein DAI22_12g115800 [Oryza sativa Japonica Group]|nr:hypothetical protein DAI22_12g115800 [Oryza sativa Japonica Group]
MATLKPWEILRHKRKRANKEIRRKRDLRQRRVFLG